MHISAISIMKYLLLLLLFTLVAVSCRSQKIDPDQYDKPIIFFGSGGGFTGLSKQYCLTTDGDLYAKTSINADWRRIQKGKAEDAQPYFTNIDSLNIQNIEIDSPGNHYRYVEYATTELKHRVTWGRNPDEIPEDMKLLYRSLNTLVKDIKQNDK
jgi:hypothetical protein